MKRLEGKYMRVMRIQEIQNWYVRLWKELTGWKLFLFYTVHYTILFVLLSQLIFWPFLKAGKGLIWKNDGLPQVFMRLLHIRRMCHESFYSYLSGMGWNISLYDFQSGLVTQDTQIGFPEILAALWKEDNIDGFYNLYVVANYYMIGLSFSAFGFFFRQKPVPIMTGAIAYTFCGYALYAVVRHPHFGITMVFLPLLLVGVEKVLHKKKAWLLTGMVFLSLTTHFGLYFSCMQVVFVTIYICVRFFDIYEENRLREFLKMTGRMLVWGSTGVLLACFSVIPAFLQIFGSGRVGRDITNFTNMLHYNLGYYKNFMLNFMVVPNGVGTWVRLGFSVIAPPAVILLFLRREKKERSLRVFFIIFTTMLCIPAVAYVMSGFSSVSERYCFGYAFLVSAILMFMVPHFADMERGIMAVMGVLLTIYFMVCCFGLQHTEYYMRPFIMLLMAVQIFASCNIAGKKGRRWIPLCCLLVTCFSVWYSSYLRYSPNEGNYVKEFVDNPYKELGLGQYASLAKCNAIREDQEFYRVTGNNILPEELNAAFFYGLNGLTAYPYYGLSNGYLEWMDEMEVARGTMKHRIYDLDARSALISLASMKYYAERKTESSFAPYGFLETEEIQNDKNRDVIWENSGWLPLGYTYENYIDIQQYGELSALGKQEAQLQAVVLEEKPTFTALKTTDVVTTAVQIPYEVVGTKDLIWENGKLEVKEPRASMTLTCTGEPASEMYLRIVNLDLTEGDSPRCWWLKAATEETTANAGFSADAFIYTHGQKTQMLNLGYSEEGYRTITITFPEKGTFLLEDVEIWCQPMGNYAREIDKLQEETLENVKLKGEGVTGTLSVTKDKFLCLSIPYMNGWKAYVDGKEVKLYHANTAFMGVEIPEGEHEIELRYRIPGLTVGLFMSGAGVICLIAIIVSLRIVKR